MRESIAHKNIRFGFCVDFADLFDSKRRFHKDRDDAKFEQSEGKGEELRAGGS